MDYKSSSVIKAIKQRDIVDKIVCKVLISFGFSNMKLQALEVRNRKYLRLKKQYSKYITDVDTNNTALVKKKVCWVCWLQGEEAAPEIVKLCLKSIKHYISDREVIIIDENNMFEYVDFPNWLMEKKEKGIIPNAQFSDILRTELLYQYGGLWIDATVLLTGAIPRYVYERNFFMYKIPSPNEVSIAYNNWLIYSNKGSAIINNMRVLLYEYWAKETVLKDYFIFHIFLTIIKDMRKKWFEDIYIVTDELPHTLGRILFDEFDEVYWEELKKMTSIHKLTYKWNDKTSIKNTFLEFIMENRNL